MRAERGEGGLGREGACRGVVVAITGSTTTWEPMPVGERVQSLQGIKT